jgi:hypothetical protein
VTREEEIQRRFAWDAYFAGIASISHHPKAGTDGARSIALCAKIADQMLAERDARFPANREAA